MVHVDKTETEKWSNLQRHIGNIENNNINSLMKSK